jgi:hypothetical protein
MAPNLAPSQHNLIRAMILDKKLKTREMANVSEYSECLIKAICLNLHYFGTTKAPLNSGRGPWSITPPMLEDPRNQTSTSKKFKLPLVIHTVDILLLQVPPT